jgi:hemoglobin-like flavoprotein
MPNAIGPTPQQIAAVKSSFAQIVPAGAAFAADFYDRLFRAHPALRGLFSGDMTAQQGKLVDTLAYVVRGLHDFDSIRGAVRELGLRHRGYRAEPAHYDAVGRALIEALAAKLGAGFTPELRAAWTAAYGAVAEEMKAAAGRRAA